MLEWPETTKYVLLINAHLKLSLAPPTPLSLSLFLSYSPPSLSFSHAPPSLTHSLSLYVHVLCTCDPSLFLLYMYLPVLVYA